MPCNCGVGACLPGKIRNAKSFPVFKSKGEILTSDTGFPTQQWCGSLELPLKDSLENTSVLHTSLTGLHTREYRK